MIILLISTPIIILNKINYFAEKVAVKIMDKSKLDTKTRNMLLR